MRSTRHCHLVIRMHHDGWDSRRYWTGNPMWRFHPILLSEHHHPLLHHLDRHRPYSTKNLPHYLTIVPYIQADSYFDQVWFNDPSPCRKYVEQLCIGEYNICPLIIIEAVVVFRLAIVMDRICWGEESGINWHPSMAIVSEEKSCDMKHDFSASMSVFHSSSIHYLSFIIYTEFI